MFRARTTAVLLDVVVRDKRGRPVRDLRPDEITVLENGVAREVRSFRLVDAGTGVAARLPPRRRAPRRPTPLRRVTLMSLVFDHLGQNARQLALKAAQDYLNAPLPATHRVAVFSLDQRLRMLQGFTRDVEALSAAVTRATSSVLKEDAPPLPGASRERAGDTAYAKVGDSELSATERSTIASDNADPQFRETILRMQALASTIDTSQRGHATFYPLMALARAQGAPRRPQGDPAVLGRPAGAEQRRGELPDRDQRGQSRQRQHLRHRCARPRHRPRPAGGRRGAGESRPHQPAGRRPERRRPHVDGRDAERRAGGRVAAIVDRNRSCASSPRAPAASSSPTRTTSARAWIASAPISRATTRSPTLPQSGEADGRFRKIDVKVARKGVDVTSRSGYFALPASDGTPLLPYELPLLAAAAATPAPRAFDFQAGAFRFHETPRGRQFTLVAEVPIAALAVEEDKKTQAVSPPRST